MENLMSIVPLVAIGTLAFLFGKFLVDVARGKYRG
jgi:hypothetical protein